jgi:hypothetical protein
MQLDSVRSLKQELNEKFTAPKTVFQTVNTFENLQIPSIYNDHDIAFGVSRVRGGGKKDYALSVRVAPGMKSFLLDQISKFFPRGKELDIKTNIAYKALGAVMVDPIAEAFSSGNKTLRPGNSCGHFKITAGTLGGFVTDGEHDYVLSNNHVIANCDNCEKGDKTLQPGPYDIDKANPKFDVIAKLSNWCKLSRTTRDNVDAAIARVEDDFNIEYHDYEGIGVINPEAIDDRYEVDRVIKRGRTTKVTRGQVSTYELDGVTVGYPNGHITFDGLIEFTGDSGSLGLPGDSGSVIFCEETLRPYGLLFAGGGGMTLANFMPDVLERLNVEFVK